LCAKIKPICFSGLKFPTSHLAAINRTNALRVQNLILRARNVYLLLSTSYSLYAITRFTPGRSAAQMTLVLRSLPPPQNTALRSGVEHHTLSCWTHLRDSESFE